MIGVNDQDGAIAISKKEAAKIPAEDICTKQYFEDFGGAVIEVWSYDPIILERDGCVDVYKRQVQHSAEPEHPEILHHHEGFDFVPANRSLSAVEVGLVNVMSRETVLKRYLDGIKKNYDYVLLDCRPSLGMLVINALSAADHVLIPVQADYLAAEDMTELVGTVQSIRQQINPKPVSYTHLSKQDTMSCQTIIPSRSQ